MTQNQPRPSIVTRLMRPPWRTIVLLLVILMAAGLRYLLWSPGAIVTDGRHDRGANAIWLQHGWLGDDDWFERNNKADRITEFRDRDRVRDLATLLRDHHITDVYPHVAPTKPDGQLPPLDKEQTRLFLLEFKGFRVMPWIGGVWGVQAHPDRPEWRSTFAESVRQLLDAFPSFAGVHINIEPCPTGSQDLILLLQEVRETIPQHTVISVAAYPPPTRWHPFREVHWEETYFREVAARADQMTVMMYDTSLRNQKLYRDLMSRWTDQIIEWSGDTDVLLGLAVYDDADTDYHDPNVENLRHGLAGIHAGLLKLATIPGHYQGVAIYSEWEMQTDEWTYLRTHFLRERGRIEEPY